MTRKSLDIDDRISGALGKHSDMVRRICYVYLRNDADVDDVFQEVFLKLLLKEAPFENEEHEKAWVIRVTINMCKDTLKSFWHRNTDSIGEMELPFEDKAESDLLQTVLSLPDKYKGVIYLFYYEGYTVPEMTKMLQKKESTIYSLLHRARVLIKQNLGSDEIDYSF